MFSCQGVPILFEVLREEGKEMPRGMDGMTKEQWELKEEFEKKRGYWHSFWEDFLRLSPEFFAAYVEFSSVPWTNEGGGGVLEPKVVSISFRPPFPLFILGGFGVGKGANGMMHRSRNLFIVPSMRRRRIFINRG
jgi:hypothetical protein